MHSIKEPNGENLGRLGCVPDPASYDTYQEMTAPFPQTTLVTTIAGEPIPALAREFGTPVYVYDAAPIVRRIAQLKQFDVIRYAQKACSNLAILDLDAPPRRAWSMP